MAYEDRERAFDAKARFVELAVQAGASKRPPTAPTRCLTAAKPPVKQPPERVRACPVKRHAAPARRLPGLHVTTVPYDELHPQYRCDDIEIWRVVRVRAPGAAST